MTPRIGLACPWLAPLAGHSDLAFRLLCREQGAAVACTEMVSARGLIYGEDNGKGRNATKELLRTTEADSPLVVQLFGDEPEFLGRAVALLRSWGFGWFDLNLGCAVPKVTKSGAGAALAKDLRRAAVAAKAMLEAAGGLAPLSGPADNSAAAVPEYTPASRVGFKLRLGWSREEENYLELGRELAQCGAAWLVLHPRYARQGFSGCADYTALEKLVRAVKIPVMASGDLFDAKTALRVAGQSGVSGLMFARGAMHNPVIFKDYLLELEKTLENNADKAEDKNRRADAIFLLRKVILRHAELIQTVDAAPERHLLKMRGAVLRYVRELPGSKAFRQAVSLCGSWAEFYKLLEDFLGGEHAGN
jgi:tRNA-dihydrouridine synthase B